MRRHNVPAVRGWAVRCGLGKAGSWGLGTARMGRAMCDGCPRTVRDWSAPCGMGRMSALPGWASPNIRKATSLRPHTARMAVAEYPQSDLASPKIRSLPRRRPTRRPRTVPRPPRYGRSRCADGCRTLLDGRSRHVRWMPHTARWASPISQRSGVTTYSNARMGVAQYPQSDLASPKIRSLPRRWPTGRPGP